MILCNNTFVHIIVYIIYSIYPYISVRIRTYNTYERR